MRVEQEPSQERLALAAAIDRAYVGRVERGSENVTVTTLEAMTGALSVPVAMLLSAPDPDAELPMTLRAGWRANNVRPPT